MPTCERPHILPGTTSPWAISRSAAGSGAGWPCPSSGRPWPTCSAGSTPWRDGPRIRRSSCCPWPRRRGGCHAPGALLKARRHRFSGSPASTFPQIRRLELAREPSHEDLLAHLEAEEKQHAQIGGEQQFGELLRCPVGQGHHAVFENELDIGFEQDEQIDGVEAEEQERQTHEDERKPGAPVKKIEPLPADELDHIEPLAARKAMPRLALLPGADRKHLHRSRL